MATTNSHMRHDSVMMIYLNENCPLNCLASFMRQNVFPAGRGEGGEGERGHQGARHQPERIKPVLQSATSSIL